MNIHIQVYKIAHFSPTTKTRRHAAVTGLGAHAETQRVPQWRGLHPIRDLGHIQRFAHSLVTEVYSCGKNCRSPFFWPKCSVHLSTPASNIYVRQLSQVIILHFHTIYKRCIIFIQLLSINSIMHWILSVQML